MKYTLLPPIEKQIIRREYLTRLAIVFCFMLSVAGLAGILALLPSSYRALRQEKQDTDLVVNMNKGDPADVAQAKIQLAADSSLLAKLSDGTGKVVFSDVIKKISEARGSSKITAFSISKPDAKTISISIQGISPTRDELLALKDRLSATVPGGNVDLPISELADNTDIRFSINITWPLQ